MTFLLDVNVLIALLDPGSLMHDQAHLWFGVEGHTSFATCPIVENGVLRIMGNPRFPGSLGSPAAVVPALLNLRTLQGHQFWHDDISVVASPHLAADRLGTHGLVTDSYLLALAVSRGGRLATFDRRIATGAVVGGREALCLIA